MVAASRSSAAVAASGKSGLVAARAAAMDMPGEPRTAFDDLASSLRFAGDPV
jgi:hypothetical protein